MSFAGLKVKYPVLFRTNYSFCDYYTNNNCTTNKNFFSILRYFYLLEISLNYPNGTLSNYCENNIISFSNFNFGVNSEIEAKTFDSLIFQKSKLYLFIEKAIEEVEELTYKQIQSFHTNCEFIESVRANMQRLYTFSSQGTSFNQYLVKFIDKKYPTDFISKWIKEFEIGDGINYDDKLIAGVGTQLYIKRGDEEINIVDLGYGVTQFLALLFRIVYDVHEKYNMIAI
jgi:hypothetical protein